MRNSFRELSPVLEEEKENPPEGTTCPACPNSEARAAEAARALPVSRPAAVCGAIAFAFGGYAFGVSHNPSYLFAHLTLPWVLWAALRVAAAGAPRHIAALGALWALVFLAGDAQQFALCP